MMGFANSGRLGPVLRGEGSGEGFSRSFETAQRLRGSDLQSLFAELRTVNLSRIKPQPELSSMTAAAMAAAAIASETGLEPYEVQHHAALVMARGGVAEMATGEGKTIAVGIAAAVIAATGRSVHVATANAYLAKRDQSLMTRVFKRLGLTCGLVEHDTDPRNQKHAYDCDITYGTADTFAFDYLGDIVKRREQSKRPLGVSRSLGNAPDVVCLRRHAMVIDEIDHILIDEATTPLILSIPTSDHDSVADEAYADAERVVTKLEQNVDWTIHAMTGRSTLTPRGIARSLKHVPTTRLNRPWTEYVRRAIDAAFALQRDVDYVVRDGEVILIDPATGRLAEGRQWQDGLYQAVQQHESLPVTAEPISAAQITRWRFMRLYCHLSGCSGTAWDCRDELQQVYGLTTTQIKPRLPSQRLDLAPNFSANGQEKWQRIADEVQAIHSTGRPVLIGTCTVAESKQLADELLRRRFTVRVLNGTQDDDEASIVTLAGQRGAITVATDMAGRGTDILVPDEVALLGGLHVIVTEPRHSPRLDRQLIGRCARQGQPGTSRTFVAADDSLLLQHDRGLSRFLMRRLKPTTAAQPLWSAVTRAARRSESELASARSRLAKRESQRDHFLLLTDVSPESNR